MRGGVFYRADAWIGKALLVPPIVRFCQWSGRSQYWLHNHLWLLALLLFCGAAMAKGSDVFAGIFFVLFMRVAWATAKNPDRAFPSSTWFRLALVALEANHTFAHALGKPFLLAGTDVDLSCGNGFLMLIAEYAATIKTIPPLETEARGVLVREG